MNEWQRQQPDGWHEAQQLYLPEELSKYYTTDQQFKLKNVKGILWAERLSFGWVYAYRIFERRNANDKSLVVS